MSSRSHLTKNKKPSTEDALKRVNDLIKEFPTKPKKKRRKPVRFEINKDPKTGHRFVKGTYQPSCSKKSVRCQGLSAFVVNDIISNERPSYEHLLMLRILKSFNIILRGYVLLNMQLIKCFNIIILIC